MKGSANTILAITGIALVLGLAMSTSIFFMTKRVQAVPSYARQTGLPCSSCHFTPPELTPLGRLFKLNGYTMTGIKLISAHGTSAKSGLSLLSFLPLSAQLQFSMTSTNAVQPGTQNGNVELPQQASLFLAGALSTHVGSFIQVTYEGQSDHFSWDNTDVRYANHHNIFGKDTVLGLDFNNSPTVEDLWNDTPAWGFPFVGSDVAPSPLAGTFIDGGLAQDVAGVGGYAMWDNHLYGAGFIYRSAHLGGLQPNPGIGFGTNIQGVAPYWRVAWQQTYHDNYLEVGTYGMHLASTPNAVTGPRDYLTDVAADLQWERTLPWKQRNDVLTFHTTFIHENSDLLGSLAAGAAGFGPHVLNTFQANAIYHIANKFAPVFGVFGTTGTTDPTLYGVAPVSGSATGNPLSKGYIFGLSYWPVQNIGLTAQYTGYTRFNGGNLNYDGSGRKASGNNGIYLMIWLLL